MLLKQNLIKKDMCNRTLPSANNRVVTSTIIAKLMVDSKTINNTEGLETF